MTGPTGTAHLTAHLPAHLVALVQDSDKEWKALGVKRSDRIALQDELGSELGAADAAGFPPSHVLGDDPREGARDWAIERDLIGRSDRLAMVLAASLVPIMAGLAIATASTLTLHQQALLLGWLLGLAVGYSGALVAANTALRRHFDRRRQLTVRLLAVALPAGGVVAGAAGRLVAATLDYAFKPATFAAVLAVVTAAFAIAITAARALALRSLAIHPEATPPFGH